MKNQQEGTCLIEVFNRNLASYAQKHQTQGRKHPQTPDPDRLPFQRDRDRIIHSTAFRRLKGKLQVINPTQNDHYRNRLTHTLEVAQISRDLARELRLNEDLAETIALAHDLGHPPFGHAGEFALNQKMREHHLNFDHNKQSLRIIQIYEKRYQEFKGLNLTQEVIEGIQKHESLFFRGKTRIYSPHLESQLVDICDEIAYLSADIEDGLKANFFKLSDLQHLTIIKEATKNLNETNQQFIPAVARSIIKYLLKKIKQFSAKNLKTHNIVTLEDVQNTQKRIIFWSDDFFADFNQVKSFLMKKFYQQPAVKKHTDNGQKILKDLFDFFLQNSAEIPPHFMPEEILPQRICDYIAGMTDEFAIKLHKKIILPSTAIN